jgi:hypothetical protein
MTLWESQSDLDASAEVAARIRQQAGAKAGATGTPTVETYEVALTPSSRNRSS